MPTLRILSDLHHEFDRSVIASLGADVVILAGDTDLGMRGARWALETFPGQPVLYLAGNHEYYRHDFRELDNQFTRLDDAVPEFHFMNDREVRIGGVRFLGCTLWTDFLAHGPEARETAISAALARVNDYHQIRVGEEGTERMLTPADTIRRHDASRAFLESRLADPFDGPTVVITPHPPSLSCMDEPFRNHSLAPAFASRLDGLIERYRPDLWIFGHIHRLHDAVLHETRLLANPRGYIPKAPVAGFRENLVVTLP